MCLRINKAKRREIIESEKYEVNPCGEKRMKGMYWIAKSMKKALRMKPPIIPLLCVVLLTYILFETKFIGALSLS
jgi:hypothetical protein